MVNSRLMAVWLGRCGMERDHEAETQESSRGGARQAGWLGAQRGQMPRQPHKWSQGWSGQKPQEENCRPSQCTPSASWPPQEIIEVIVLISARFGVTIIGLGQEGLRFTDVPNAHTA